jgi:glutamate N-acetyltransferase/amino-acid N-acetyltransferase
MAAIGRSGVLVEPGRITISLGNLRLVSGGKGAGFSEERASELLAREKILITVSLGKGKAETRFWTTDLSYEYVKINAQCRT